jgi:hypothetical protein
MTKKRDSAKKFMTDRGLSPTLLPKAIFVHEMLGLAMLAVTWSLAYHFPPSELPLLAGPIKKINSAIPNQLSWLNTKPGRSYVEASCCRKLIRPLTIPGKLYFTFAIMANFDTWGAGIEDVDKATSSSAGKPSTSRQSAFMLPPPSLHGRVMGSASAPLNILM